MLPKRLLLALIGVGCMFILRASSPIGAVTDTFGVEVHAPPARWDPLTASDAELNYYNFPPRPTDPQELERWKSVVLNKRWIWPEFRRAPHRSGSRGEILDVTGR
jgi:hypothetical protein